MCGGGGGGGGGGGVRGGHLSWTEHTKGGARSHFFNVLFWPDSKVHLSTAA